MSLYVFDEISSFFFLLEERSVITTILKTDKNYSKVEFFVKIDILNEYLIYMKVRKIIPHIHCIRVKLFANFRILRISFFEYDNVITNEDVIMIFINRIYNERILYYI